MKNEIIVLILALFVLSACTDNGGTITTNTKTFIGGTDGLIIEFLDDEPPAEVTDGGTNPFTVTSKIENMGEAEVLAEDITLTLKGFDPLDFSYTASLTVSPDEDILKNEINPDTGESIVSPSVYVTWPGEFNFAGSLSGNSVFPFVIDMCYQYKTLATSQLCIKEDLLDSTNTDVCTVSETKDVQNSGGPVQIISFEEFTAGPDKVSFTITVKDADDGGLSALDSACDDTPTNENVVTLTVDTGMPDLSCSGFEPISGSTAVSGTLKLTTGQRQLRCTQEIAESERTDKIKIVDMTVEYDYEETISTEVLVKHIATS